MKIWTSFCLKFLKILLLSINYLKYHSLNFNFTIYFFLLIIIIMTFNLMINKIKNTLIMLKIIFVFKFLCINRKKRCLCYNFSASFPVSKMHILLTFFFTFYCFIIFPFFFVVNCFLICCMFMVLNVVFCVIMDSNPLSMYSCVQKN